MILPAGFTVLFGGIDVSLAVHDFSASTRIADRARATFQLDVRDLPSSAVDLGSIIEVRQRERPIFTGEVVSARVDGDRVAISAATGSNLTDTTVARQTTFGLTPHEQVRSLFVQAGLSDAEFSIEGFDDPPEEYFEVTAPVRGLAVAERAYVGGVAFVPKDVASSLGLVRQVSPDLKSAFLDADCHAVAGVVGVWASDAEADGLSKIRSVVSRLVTDARCTSLLGPQRTVTRSFARSDAVVAPVMVPCVLVRSVLSGRGWLRQVETTSALSAMKLPRELRSIDLFAPTLTSDLRLASESIYRATTSQDGLAANLALQDAVEFYSASFRVAKIFAKQELTRVRDDLRSIDWLTPAQRERLVGLADSVNQSPVLTKFRARLIKDEVPFHDAEMDLLRRVRDHRNDAVHGRAQTVPHPRDLRSCLQFVSRAIVFSAARLGSTDE